MSFPPGDTDTAFARRRRLSALIKEGNLGQQVLEELLPDGKPHLYEKDLWDYKQDLPLLPTGVRPSDSTKQLYDAKMAEIVKDAVAFYNSYGGYLLAGVSDKARQIVGFANPFDCDELNKRLKGATRHDIDCHFSLLRSPYSPAITVGLLFIPQRAPTKDPAQFRRDAPPNPAGERAHKRDDIYFRIGPECRPAKSPEDYTFLCSPSRCQSPVLTDILPSSHRI
jgi:hypothetical protein